MLTPNEIVRRTKEMRRIEPEMIDGDDALFDRVQAVLNNSVYFQHSDDASNGYVFVVDSRDASGEYRIGDYAHDYLEELDWSNKVGTFDSLAASTLHAMKCLVQDLP